MASDLGAYLRRVRRYVGIGGSLAGAAITLEPAVLSNTTIETRPSSGIEQRLKEAPKPPKKIRYQGGVAYAQEPTSVHASPKTSAADYRGEFRRLGWEVYDTKTDDLSKITPKERLQFALEFDQFKGAYLNDLNGIRSYFSQDEQRLIQILFDGRNDNGEFKFAFVTPENRISMTLVSSDTNIGKNGLYVVRKNLTQSQAENIRKISSDYRKH